jgi:hypothetical protein
MKRLSSTMTNLSVLIKINTQYQINLSVLIKLKALQNLFKSLTKVLRK